MKSATNEYIGSEIVQCTGLRSLPDKARRACPRALQPTGRATAHG